MAVYTPAAVQGAGGLTQLETRIQAAVDLTNDAFANSEIFHRLNLVHMQEVNYDGDQTGATGPDQLDWVRTDPTVASLRNQHHADLVALISNNAGGCGWAYVMRNPGPQFESSAFSLTSHYCAVGDLTFAHEIGHNLGFEHDPANSTTTPAGASYPWSFGHYFQLPNGSYRRSIMSYGSPCPGTCSRVHHFSNPNVLYQGTSTGLIDERDNARTANLTGNIVANFRQGDWLFADRFEDRGFFLGTGPLASPPLTDAEACEQIDTQLTIYEEHLAEQEEHLDENDEEAWQQHLAEVAAVAEVRDRLVKYCE